MRRLSILSMLLPAIWLVVCGDVLRAVQTSGLPPQFGPKWKTLVGEWKGEDRSGSPSGVCGFHLELSEHVIVRTNHAVLRGTGDSAHDDLMVISPETNGDQARASYFDNEGHTIEYSAAWSADGNTLTFLSKPGAAPQFKLTYKKLNADSFNVTFEMAPPGQPASFRSYVSGKIVRSAGHA